MASPIVLKPIALAEEKVCPCVLRLSAPPPKKLKATRDKVIRQGQSDKEVVDEFVLQMPTPETEPLLRTANPHGEEENIDLYGVVIKEAKEVFEDSWVYSLGTSGGDPHA
ncbi:hypothetical protein [Chthonomonas calidirosea]|uniref:hypothetical protein n=1 Tax=Chthonomonas calidirosea TaxID=454171 RepID=UPI0003A03E30|nr:hypothetical protein [Chthonomonas calidirosea]